MERTVCLEKTFFFGEYHGLKKSFNVNIKVVLLNAALCGPPFRMVLPTFLSNARKLLKNVICIYTSGNGRNCRYTTVFSQIIGVPCILTSLHTYTLLLPNGWITFDLKSIFAHWHFCMNFNCWLFTTFNLLTTLSFLPTSCLVYFFNQEGHFYLDLKEKFTDYSHM